MIEGYNLEGLELVVIVARQWTIGDNVLYEYYKNN